MLTLFKCGSDRHPFDYEVHKDNRGGKIAKPFKLMNTYFAVPLDVSYNRLQKRAQEYDSQIIVEIAKSAENLIDQMKTAVFLTAEALSVLFLLDNFRTTCDSRIIHDCAAIRSF